MVYENKDCVTINKVKYNNYYIYIYIEMNIC